MTIETKFTPGDWFYAIRRIRSRVTTKIVCPACHDGIVTLSNGENIKCGATFNHNEYACFNGKLEKYVYKWEPYRDRIHCDHIEIYMDSPKIQDILIDYKEDYGETHSEVDCFRTLEEAQAECDRRNNGIP